MSFRDCRRGKKSSGFQEPKNVPRIKRSQHRQCDTTGLGRWSWTQVGLTLILGVPLPALLCLGSWKFGRMGCGAGQDDGIQKSKSTKPRCTTTCPTLQIECIGEFDEEIKLSPSLLGTAGVGENFPCVSLITPITIYNPVDEFLPEEMQKFVYLSVCLNRFKIN